MTAFMFFLRGNKGKWVWCGFDMLVECDDVIGSEGIEGHYAAHILCSIIRRYTECCVIKIPRVYEECDAGIAVGTGPMEEGMLFVFVDHIKGNTRNFAVTGGTGLPIRLKGLFPGFP